MSKVVPVPPPGQPSSGKLLPLREGERLTREEFHRRYKAMPGLKKAELIEGVVCLPPVGFEWRSRSDFALIGWLHHYQVRTPGILGGSNSTVILDEVNEPQPDSCLVIRADRGGRTRLDRRGNLVGTPELVAEVAATSQSHDLGPKKEAYRRNGVLEYLVWRVHEQAIDWFLLRGGEYEPLEPDADGILKSEVFPGLWLDAAARIRGDDARVIQVLDQGLLAPEHAAFVARLERAAGKER